MSNVATRLVDLALPLPMFFSAKFIVTVSVGSTRPLVGKQDSETRVAPAAPILGNRSLLIIVATPWFLLKVALTMPERLTKKVLLDVLILLPMVVTTICWLVWPGF